MSAPKISAVRAVCYSRYSGRVAIDWDTPDGARFHLWTFVTPAGVELAAQREGILYKTPPAHLKRGDVGYHPVRELSPTSKSNAAMLAAALRVIERDGLFAKVIQEEGDRLAAEEAAAIEARRVHQLKEAGPELAAMLRAVLNTWRESVGSGAWGEWDGTSAHGPQVKNDTVVAALRLLAAVQS